MRSLVVLLCVGVVHAADPMPSPWEDYADVLARVKGGETIRIAVGVPATGEYVAVGGVPAEVKHGLWRCYKDGQLARMVLESAADPMPVPVVTVPKYPILNTIAPKWFPQSVQCVGQT